MVTEVKPFPRASRQERLHCSRPTPMPAIARISVARGIHPSPLNRCPRAERESFETLVGGLVAVRPLPPPRFLRSLIFRSKIFFGPLGTENRRKFLVWAGGPATLTPPLRPSNVLPPSPGRLLYLSPLHKMLPGQVFCLSRPPCDACNRLGSNGLTQQFLWCPTPGHSAHQSTLMSAWLCLLSTNSVIKFSRGIYTIWTPVIYTKSLTLNTFAASDMSYGIVY